MCGAGRQSGLPVGSKPLFDRGERLPNLCLQGRVSRYLAAAGLACVIVAFPCWAQNQQAPRDPFGGNNPNPTAPTTTNEPFGGSLWSEPSVLPPLPTAPDPIDALRLLNAESCNSWTEAGSRSPTVSVARLAIPGKAEGEYQKGCSALKDKRLDDAEDHVRSAIKLYPDYAAAWVVLGQVLDAKNKRNDARAACSQARSVDPSYIAPYLCLADFSANEDDWKEVSILSGGALAIDPTGNPYAFYYDGTAEFHLGNLQRAARDAQNAITLDKWHHLPQVHLLMAQIYQAQGDPQAQAVQLRDYLKYAANSQTSAGVKSTLAHLEAQTAKQLLKTEDK
jgi:hypothetical protein